MSPLEALLSFDPAGDLSESLEWFVASALFEGGVWSTPRTSDGVTSYRVIERTPTRLRVCGRIWEIDQTLRSFWLDVAQTHALPERTTWTLYFDVDAASLGGHRARNAVDAIKEPDDVAWTVTLEGGEVLAFSNKDSPWGPVTMTDSREDELFDDFGAPTLTEAQLETLLTRARETDDTMLRQLVQQHRTLRSAADSVLRRIEATEGTAALETDAQLKLFSFSRTREVSRARPAQRTPTPTLSSSPPARPSRRTSRSSCTCRRPRTSSPRT